VAFLSPQCRSWEIIVVDDGGGDFEGDAFVNEANVRLLKLPRNQGKGAAVRAGMLAATGRVRVFTDIDLPYDLELLPTIERLISKGAFHVIIGDRTLSSSTYHSRTTVARRMASAVFSQFVGTVVTGGFFDTQCGIKGIRGDVAELLFPMLRLNRFAFDVELVYVALKNHLDIHRIPVQLRHNETSSVRLLRDASQGVVDVARIKWNQLHGQYESAALDDMIRSEFEAAVRAAQVQSNRGGTIAG
jgi:glycosyltransferase involved in cell wall biosynthesis